MSDDPNYEAREARLQRYYAAVHVDRLLNSANAAMRVADDEQAELRATIEAALPDDAWAVYETRNGKVWTCSPPTHENAKREADLGGPGHEAIPRHWAKAMANAWCHGRMAGIESMRAEVTP